MLRSTDASAFGQGAAGQRDGRRRWGGSGGHSVRLCCNRSLTGHSDVNRRAKTPSDYCVGGCSGVKPRGSVK